MKTIPVIPSAGLLRAIAVTAAVLSSVLMGGVSVKAATTNYFWYNTGSDYYTNDLNWAGGIAPMGGLNTLGPKGSVNYVANITNGGTILYGDGGGGPSTGYTWTNVLGTLQIASSNNSSGAFAMSSGSLVVSNANANAFILGGGASSTATFTQSGGALTVVRDAATLFQDSFMIANGVGSSGTYTLSGGVMTNLSGLEIGEGGPGTINVSGGTLIDNGWFGVGRGGTTGNSSGIFNLSGSGTVYILRNTGNEGADNGLYLGQGSTNSSIANISGGTLYAVEIGMGGGGAQSSQSLNMSAGTVFLGVRGVNSLGTGTQLANIGGGTFRTADMLIVTTVAGSGSLANILADGTNWTWGAGIPANLTNSSFIVNGVAGTGKVTFAPEANRTITLNNQWFGPGNLVINGPGTVAIGGADSYTGGTTLTQGNLTFNNGGSVADPTLTIPVASTLTFNTTGTTTFTNIIAGAGNVVVGNTGVVNVGSNLQNTGKISQNNGILVVNGSILNASLLTNSSPATTGPLVAQGTIMTPIGIGTNSSLEAGTTVQAGTLAASNVVLNGTWIVKINTATTVGGGVNDLLICSNLTLNPSSVLSIQANTPPSIGNYVIAEYSGPAILGNAQFGTVTNATGDAMSISYSTPGEIILKVTAINQANLVWAATNLSPNLNWDVNTTPNWTNTATSALSTFHQQDAVTLSAMPGDGVTNRVSVTGQVLPSSINISGGLPYLIAGTGYISGGTGINYSDTNVSGIYTSGNNYTGAVTVTAGVLQLGVAGSSWLGVSNSTTVNGGTLDLNGQGVGVESLVLSGTGSALAGTNGGAINNSASTSPGQSAGPLNITLNGDTTFNASGARWDIGVASPGAGGGSFTGNGHALTKIGNQPIWMHEVGDIGVGAIDIQQGLLGFEYTIGMGVQADTITVEPGATLGLFQLSSNSILKKAMVLNNNATLQSGGAAGSSNNFAGPITLNGTNTITTSIFPLNLTGNMTGNGGYILSGTGPLYLGGNDSYTGPTLLGPNSVLALESGGSIPTTPLIYMSPAASTMIDASGAGSMTLNSGQTLEGSGFVAGNFTASSGSTVILGTNAIKYGTMIFTNNLTLNGATTDVKISDANNVGIDNDIILVDGNLAVNSPSTFMVTPLSGLAGSYALMEINGSVPASTANVQVSCPNPRYSFSTSFGTDINSKQALLLNVVGGSAGPLEWQGYVTPNWDMGTLNWLNTGSSAHDQFYTGDETTFDDNSSVTSVTVANSLLIAAGMNMDNVANTYTFTGGGVIYGPLNMEGNGSGAGGTTILAMSNAPAFTSIDASAGTLVYDLQGLTNYNVAALSDSNGYRGMVIFGGTNTATLVGNAVTAPILSFGYSPDFDGSIWVTNGILQYTNVDALGVDTSFNNDPNFSPLIATNNGTLNLNGVPAGTSGFASPGGAKWIRISGNGFNGQGALTDSGNNSEPNGAYCYLYFDGDATIGMTSTRCDEHVLSGNLQQIQGNSHNLTFVGGGAFFIYQQSDGDTHLGNIDVASTNGGRLAFQGGPNALGTTTGYLTVEPAGEVTFFNFSNNLDSVHLGIQKNVWLKGNAVIDSGGNAGSESNNFDGPIFLTGTNLIGVRYDMHAWNNIMDSNSPGGFILGNDSVGASGATASLWLDGVNNSYTGPTIVSNATLRVGAGSSLGSSAYVQVNTNAVLSLSATPSYSFGTGQTLAGNGIVVGPASGNLNFNSGSTVVIGLPTATGPLNASITTLSISNTVVFGAGSTIDLVANKTAAAAGAVPANKLTSAKSLTLGGTLVVTNLGSKPFVAGDSLVLFSATTITTNGSFTISPATPGPGLVWNITGIPGSGTLSVVNQFPSFTTPPPISFSTANNQFALKWPTNYVGYYYLQVETNPVTVGLTNDWVPYNGSVSATLSSPGITNAVDLNNGTVFYRLMTNAP